MQKKLMKQFTPPGLRLLGPRLPNGSALVLIKCSKWNYSCIEVSTGKIDCKIGFRTHESFRIDCWFTSNGYLQPETVLTILGPSGS